MTHIWPEQEPRCRIIKSPDVTDKNSWPKAPSQFLFILDAINLAGAVLFGKDWDNKEIEAVHWPQSPRDGRTQAKHKALHPPKRHSPALNVSRRSHQRPSGSASTAKLPYQSKFQEHVFDWIAEQHHEIWKQNQAAIVRLTQTVEWLAQQCRDGRLKSYWRFESGGVLDLTDASEWNVDDALSTFVVVGGKRREAFLGLDYKYHGPFQTYAFFDRFDLKNVLARQPNAPLIVGDADLSNLSPYLQSAVRLALRKGYKSRDTCDSNPVREAEIRAAWPDLLPDVTITKNAVEAIARVIGFPDNKAIETGLRAKAEKKGVAPKP